MLIGAASVVQLYRLSLCRLIWNFFWEYTILNRREERTECANKRKKLRKETPSSQFSFFFQSISLINNALAILSQLVFIQNGVTVFRRSQLLERGFRRCGWLLLSAVRRIRALRHLWLCRLRGRIRSVVEFAVKFARMKVREELFQLARNVDVLRIIIS